MLTEKIFQAEVTLSTGVHVKALVQAKNIFHAHKSLEWVYGAGKVGLVTEQSDPNQASLTMPNESIACVTSRF